MHYALRTLANGVAMKIKLIWLSTTLFVCGTAIAAALWQSNHAPLDVGQSTATSTTAESNSPKPSAVPSTGRRSVVETKTKLVDYTVMTKVYEKHQKEVNYTVMKPVYETREKTITYTVCTMVPETKTKTVEYTTCRMVPDTKQKTVEYQEVRYLPTDESKVDSK